MRPTIVRTLDCRLTRFRTEAHHAAICKVYGVTVRILFQLYLCSVTQHIEILVLFQVETSIIRVCLYNVVMDIAPSNTVTEAIS
jgi:hypothetical protein